MKKICLLYEKCLLEQFGEGVGLNLLVILSDIIFFNNVI